MFEQFTKEARFAVIQAQEEARDLAHTWIGSEHLLVAVAAQEGAPGAATLARLGITPAACRAALTPAGPLGDGDAEALRALGIDLDAVRARAEERFGPGALGPQEEEPARTRRRGLPFGRNRGGAKGSRSHIPFTPRAKKALERSLREALARKDHRIGLEHVLLGVLHPEDAVTAGVLRRLGTDSATVRAGLVADLDRAA
ncbi:Clp protease N-terminal domain-containing protein [Streptomyces sp. QH1-20]|uniref:Clp protease N-terminal domain-containing protein n=1 Tax=Streptomyces sp. QH1-20 TaxID=3240934 RepID=UPI0035185595